MPAAPRLRIFAGPNGSGKSIMKQQVERTVVRGRPVDLGIYVNADEIARKLRKVRTLDLASYSVDVERSSFQAFASKSGLLSSRFNQGRFKMGHRLNSTIFTLVHERFVEYYAQLLAAFICEQLLKQRVKFSFETVFSHASKVDLMRRAERLGYKVYLYFICTEHPEINVDRVRSRVKAGGHNVPSRKVKLRYYRSLKQLLPAMGHCYHAFLFDNTDSLAQDPVVPVMFAEMKRVGPAVQWGWAPEHAPNWFLQEFLLASGDPMYASMARQVHALRSS